MVFTWTVYLETVIDRGNPSIYDKKYIYKKSKFEISPFNLSKIVIVT